MRMFKRNRLALSLTGQSKQKHAPGRYAEEARPVLRHAERITIIATTLFGL